MSDVAFAAPAVAPHLSGGDIFSTDAAIWMLAILIGGLCVLVLWGSFSGVAAKLRDARFAGKLFLPFRFKVRGDEGEHVGYLRALSVRSAAFVHQSSLPRGATIQMTLDDGATITGSVVDSRPFPHGDGSFLISVRFASQDPAVRAPLQAYVRRLAGTSGLTTA